MRRALLTVGSRERRLAAGISAVLLVAAVAIVALANGLGKPGPASQASLAPAFTGVPLQAINEACVKQVGPFVSSLESLDAGVGPNLTFNEYGQMLAASQAARGKVNISDLDAACVSVFAAAQAVLGEQVEAYNSWNDCSATTSCTRQSIESSLEDHWANAKRALSRVKASMP
jgi:hypothetical protein